MEQINLLCNKMRDEMHDEPQSRLQVGTLKTSRLQAETNGSFYLQLSSNENETGIIILYDLCSKKQFEKIVELKSGTPLKLSVPERISDGIYILQFNDGREKKYFKMTISKQ